MESLEHILQKHFGFKYPVFFKKPRQVEGGEECITRKGYKELEKLRLLLSDLHSIGIIKETPGEIENNIDHIIYSGSWS